MGESKKQKRYRLFHEHGGLCCRCRRPMLPMFDGSLDDGPVKQAPTIEHLESYFRVLEDGKTAFEKGKRVSISHSVCNDLHGRADSLEYNARRRYFPKWLEREYFYPEKWVNGYRRWWQESLSEAHE